MAAVRTNKTPAWKTSMKTASHAVEDLVMPAKLAVPKLKHASTETNRSAVSTQTKPKPAKDKENKNKNASEAPAAPPKSTKALSSQQQRQLKQTTLTATKRPADNAAAAGGVAPTRAGGAPTSRRARNVPLRFGDFAPADDLAVLSDTEAPPEASTGGDAHHNHNATHTTQPTTRDPQPPTSTSLHVHAVAPNSDTCSTAVFQPDTEAAAKVDAITRAITDQLCDAVEQDDDGRRAGEERAMAAAALRGALGGKTYYENLKTRACAAVPSPAPAAAGPALADEPLLHAVLARSMSTGAVVNHPVATATTTTTTGSVPPADTTHQPRARKAKGPRAGPRGTRRAKTASPPPSPALCLTTTARRGVAMQPPVQPPVQAPVQPAEKPLVQRNSSPEILGRSETPGGAGVVPARTPAAERAAQQEAAMLRARVAALEAQCEEERVRGKAARAAAIGVVREELQGLAGAVARALAKLDELETL